MSHDIRLLHQQLEGYQQFSVVDFFVNQHLFTDEVRANMLQNLTHLSALNAPGVPNTIAISSALVPLIEPRTSSPESKDSVSVDDVLKEVKASDKDFQSPIQQLPPPQNRSVREPRVQLLSLPYERPESEATKAVIYSNIKAIYGKYFYPIYPDPRKIPNVVANDQKDIDLMFFIGTLSNLKDLSEEICLKLFQALRDDGSLILLPTDLPTNNPIEHHQLKNTVFDKPVHFKKYFAQFFVGHIFYMKRVPVLPLVSRSFVAFTLAPGMTDSFFLRSQATLHTKLVHKTDEGWQIGGKLTSFRDTDVLPINVVTNVHKAHALITILENEWSSVSDVQFDVTEEYQDILKKQNKTRKDEDTMRKLERYILSLPVLDKYFVSYWVKTGSNSFFRALNTLFALKDMGMPLLTWDLLVDAGNRFTAWMFSHATRKNKDSILLYFKTSLFDEEGNMKRVVPLSKGDALSMIFYNFVLDVVEMYWFDIIATVFNIEIVLVNFLYPPTLTLERKKPIDFSVPLKLPQPVVKQESFPTFYLCKVKNSFYPLFPKTLIPVMKGGGREDLA